MIEYRFELDKKRAAAYREGEFLGEATISTSPGLWILDHTLVDEKARGMKVGHHLVRTVVEAAREHGVKVLPLCPYAKKEFDEQAAYQDVRAKG